MRALRPIAAGLAVVLFVAVFTANNSSPRRPVLKHEAVESVYPVLEMPENSTQEIRHFSSMKNSLVPLPRFKKAVFSGHRVPDLDSVGGAIGAAYLFKGVASVPGALNAEVTFVLDKYQVKPPPRLKTFYVNEPYVLVDHNGFNQVPRELAPERIKGIIDHHTLSQRPVYIPHPEFVYIRRWGSCCTVITSLYVQYDVEPPPSIAGVLLGGILSDTLGLTGPTTTETDVKLAKWLAPKVGIAPNKKSFKQLATEQFRAKANLTGMSIDRILNLDVKEYTFESEVRDSEVRLGWSTIESVDPFYKQYFEPQRMEHLREGMQRMKAKRKLDFLYVSVVNILERKSVFLGVGEAEMRLLHIAFPKRKIKGLQMNGTPLVSRKKQFLPPIRSVLLQATLG